VGRAADRCPAPRKHRPAKARGATQGPNRPGTRNEHAQSKRASESQAGGGTAGQSNTPKPEKGGTARDSAQSGDRKKKRPRPHKTKQKTERREEFATQSYKHTLGHQLPQEERQQQSRQGAELREQSRQHNQAADGEETQTTPRGRGAATGLVSERCNTSRDRGRRR
jgi:hypothetical protein